LKLSDDLKEARAKVEVAISEADRRADARVSGSGRSYGVDARFRAMIERQRPEIPRSGDGQPPA